MIKMHMWWDYTERTINNDLAYTTYYWMDHSLGRNPNVSHNMYVIYKSFQTRPSWSKHNDNRRMLFIKVSAYMQTKENQSPVILGRWSMIMMHSTEQQQL